MKNIKDNLFAFFIMWGVILILNQIFIFGGCFYPSCLIAALPHTGVITLIIIGLMSTKKYDEKAKEVFTQLDKWDKEAKEIEQAKIRKKEEISAKNNEVHISNDPLKAKGDAYERHIGKRFEEKGDLVIYNGLIRGYEDGGVDLVAITSDPRTINLIQCKNWTNMTMELSHIQAIYEKIQNHNMNFLNLSTQEIKKHQNMPMTHMKIGNILYDFRSNLNYLTIRKTLYIASEKVVNLEVGKHLIMIKPNIFRYEDMKIVVERI